MANWEKTNYGGFRADLGNGLSLSIHWDGTRSKGSDDMPLVAYALGVKLKRRFKSADEAKEAAERVARIMLATALERLSAVHDTPEVQP